MTGAGNHGGMANYEELEGQEGSVKPLPVVRNGFPLKIIDDLVVGAPERRSVFWVASGIVILLVVVQALKA